MDYYDKIEDYLNNRLSETEREEMVKAIQNDPDLKVVVEEYSGISLVRESLVEEELLGMFKKIEKGDKQDERKGRGRWWLIFIGMIVILVLVWKFGFTNHPETEELFAQYYQEPMWEINRSQGASVIADAVKLWNSGDKNDAIEQISSIKESSEEYILAQEYLAEMLLSSGKVEEAIRQLETLPSSDRTMWLQALAQLRKGNSNEAKSILVRIQNSPTHTYRRKAIELWSDLE